MTNAERYIATQTRRTSSLLLGMRTYPAMLALRSARRKALRDWSAR